MTLNDYYNIGVNLLAVLGVFFPVLTPIAYTLSRTKSELVSVVNSMLVKNEAFYATALEMDKQRAAKEFKKITAPAGAKMVIEKRLLREAKRKRDEFEKLRQKADTVNWEDVDDSAGK